jgi:hypothetical protein
MQAIGSCDCNHSGPGWTASTATPRAAAAGTLSQLISELDEAVAEATGGVTAVVSGVRALLAPPDPDSAFGTRYLQALQDHPGVVLAHRSVTAALGRFPTAPEPK